MPPDQNGEPAFQTLAKVEEEDGAQYAHLSIRRTLAGRRIDSYLHSRFPRFSRTAIQQLIKEGAVTVNGRPTKPSYTPRGGDAVELILPPPEPKEILPEPIPLQILYEDDDILVLDKQAGIVVHPARGNERGTLVHGLVYYSRQLAATGDPFRPGIVHRLDKDTTGVMVVAKTDEAHWRLALQFERRQVEKEYVAVVHGDLELDGDVIEAPIVAHPRVRERFVVRSLLRSRAVRNKLKKLEKTAITRYRVQRRFGDHCIVRLFPRTGRTHQLRVHLSYIGHPIVGDAIYGGRQVSLADLAGHGDPQPLIARQALHARRLKIRHPIREVPIEFSAPVPPDIRRLIDALEKTRKADG